MVPLKRRKTAAGDPGTESRGQNMFPLVVVFLLERKMGASRRAFLSQLGRKKGFQVEDLFSERVTHLVSENNPAVEVRRWLEAHGGAQTAPRLLDVGWYTESMGAGRPVEVQPRHLIQEPPGEEQLEVFTVPIYACQRRTSTQNHNAPLTDALTLLAEGAELSGDEGRGVAFRRAAAVLKALPAGVRSPAQLGALPCLGAHCLRVIQDVLENGSSSEVEATRGSERFRALKALTGVFGVGWKTADRWIRDGILNIPQLRASGQTLNRAQQAGLQHYEDLQQPVSRAEADAVAEVVQLAVSSVLPGSRVVLTGGFRRGKLEGHDVDFLITHPEEGREVGLMPKVVSWLEQKGFLLYQKTSRNSYLESPDGPGRPPSNMDRFERCLTIFRLSQKGAEPEDRGAGLKDRGEDRGAGPNRRWRAVRVDLVVSPFSQFAFALLGWTGSKLFERELRRWAGHQRDLSLSSHALYDRAQRKYLPASSEEEIFSHLGLEFIPPSERNA
ncbi:DNA-directed DNA/RNA polymerase mu [Menidia menidia]